MGTPKWYDKLAHGATVSDRQAAAYNFQKRLEACGLSWADSFDLSWYNEKNPELYEEGYGL